jgi:hypothetical protein
MRDFNAPMFGKGKKRGERCKDFIKTEDGRP